MEKLLTLILKEPCILSVCPSLVIFRTACFDEKMNKIKISLNKSTLVQFKFVVFLTICTCSRPDRIVPIAERFGLDPGAVLDNVSFHFLLIQQLKLRAIIFRN